MRAVEELLVKANISTCENFKESAQVIAKIGFKMFLGINADATNWSPDGKAFTLVSVDQRFARHVNGFNVVMGC